MYRFYISFKSCSFSTVTRAPRFPPNHPWNLTQTCALSAGDTRSSCVRWSYYTTAPYTIVSNTPNMCVCIIIPPRYVVALVVYAYTNGGNWYMRGVRSCPHPHLTVGIHVYNAVAVSHSCISVHLPHVNIIINVWGVFPQCQHGPVDRLL